MKDVALSFGLDISNMTTTSQMPLVVVMRSITAAYFAANATQRKLLAATFQRLQNLTEFELNGLASRSEADSAVGER